MSHEIDGSLTLDEIMQAIRRELRDRKTGARAGEQVDADPPAVPRGPTSNASRWERLNQHLRTADEYAPIADLPPQFVDWSPARRTFALQAAKAVKYVSRFITNKQSRFNEAIVAAVRDLTYHVRSLEESVAGLQQAQAAASTRVEAANQETRELVARLEQQLGALRRETVGKVKSAEEMHRLDALYKSFEDLFRGTLDDIKNRDRVYLPKLAGTGIGSEGMPIIDLGCGRGEWLALCKESGLHARGVDVNRLFVEKCREQGLEVIEEDVLDHLRGLPESSVGAVTAFHVFEHLPYEVWLALIDEARRVLKPGGVAIFETPNPANLTVGSYSFYMDPSHRNPLPSPMLKFMVEARGLTRVEVLDLSPLPDSFSGVDAGVAEQLNRLLCGPRDYAVLGWKADAPAQPDGAA